MIWDQYLPLKKSQNIIDILRRSAASEPQASCLFTLSFNSNAIALSSSPHNKPAINGKGEKAANRIPGIYEGK